MPRFEKFCVVTTPRVVECYSPSNTGFPFETSFACGPVKTFVPKANELKIAKAGIDSLKPFVDSSIDLEKNYDMVGVAFNAFVVNMANKNGQVISTDVALSCVENFKFKPMNIEHKRQNVVGLITGYGFSEYGTDKPIKESDVKNFKKPFNVVLSGFVWKVVNEDFVEQLENSSNPDSDSYLSISASWEMGFREFNIAVGSKSLEEARIVSELEEVGKLKNRLIHFGGNGLSEEGEELFINLVGEVLPLGIGFTENPAADVLGVKVSSEEEEEEKEEEEKEEEEEEEEDKADAKHLKTENINIESEPLVSESKNIKNEIKSNCSQNKFRNVILKKESCSNKAAASTCLSKQKNIKEKNKMVIRSIKDLSDDSLKQICASDIRELFEQEIKSASEKFSQEKAEKDEAVARMEQERAELEARIAELLSSVDALKTETAELNSVVEDFKAQAAAKEKEELFQARMSSIDEEFTLNDEERELIGEQIKDMSEEVFANWYKTFSVFAKKASVATEVKSVEDVEAKASTSGDVIDEAKASEIVEKISENAIEILKTVEAEEVGVPNSSAQQDSIREKFAKAFNSQTIKIDLAK